VESGESPVEALRREAIEEMGCSVHVDVPPTPPFLVQVGHSITDLSQSVDRDPVLFFWQAEKPGFIPGARVAVFSGTAQGEMHPCDLPGLIGLDANILKQFNSRSFTVEDVLQHQGVLIEKEPIPRGAILRPVGTVEILLELHRKAPTRFVYCLNLEG
jgi:hypothetical protein